MVLILTGLMSFVYIQFKLVKLHQQDNPISYSIRTLYYFGLSTGMITFIIFLIMIVYKKMVLLEDIEDKTSVECLNLYPIPCPIPLLLLVISFVAGILIPVITISYSPSMKSFVLKKLTRTLTSSRIVDTQSWIEKFV